MRNRITLKQTKSGTDHFVLIDGRNTMILWSDLLQGLDVLIARCERLNLKHLLKNALLVKAALN